MRLTKRQRELLTIMRDQGEELVYERGLGYVGEESISRHMVFTLLRMCAISEASDSTVGKFERYTINGTGRKLLDGDSSDLKKLASRMTRRERGGV